MEEKQGLQSTPNEEVVVETNEAIATEETTEPTSVEAKGIHTGRDRRNH